MLAKLMSDALNEAAIGKSLASKIADEKGSSKFERFLTQEGYPEVDRDVQYLRKVQELRSRATAHLKGSDYQKMLTKSLGSARGAEAVRALLDGGVMFLRSVITWVGNHGNDEQHRVEPQRWALRHLDL